MPRGRYVLPLVRVPGCRCPSFVTRRVRFASQVVSAAVLAALDEGVPSQAIAYCVAAAAVPVTVSPPAVDQLLALFDRAVRCSCEEFALDLELQFVSAMLRHHGLRLLRSSRRAAVNDLLSMRRVTVVHADLLHAVVGIAEVSPQDRSTVVSLAVVRCC